MALASGGATGEIFTVAFAEFAACSAFDYGLTTKDYGLLLEFPRIHHQNPCRFGKHAETPKKSGHFRGFFLEGSTHSALSRYLFSKASASGQSAHQTRLYTAPPPILTGKLATAVPPAVAAF